MSARRGVVLFLMLALAFPAAVLAQGRRAPMGGPGMGMGPCRGMADGPQARQGERGPRNPVQCILQWEALELSEDQTRELQELAGELEDKNAPLFEKLREARPERGELRGDPQARREARREMEPLLKEVRGNNMAAFGAALQVLDEDQRARVERVMRSGQAPRGGPAFRGPGYRRGQAMMRRGAVLMRRGQRMMMRGGALMQDGGPARWWAPGG